MRFGGLGCDNTSGCGGFPFSVLIRSISAKTLRSSWLSGGGALLVIGTSITPRMEFWGRGTLCRLGPKFYDDPRNLQVNRWLKMRRSAGANHAAERAAGSQVMVFRVLVIASGRVLGRPTPCSSIALFNSLTSWSNLVRSFSVATSSAIDVQWRDVGGAELSTIKTSMSFRKSLLRRGRLTLERVERRAAPFYPRGEGS